MKKVSTTAHLELQKLEQKGVIIPADLQMPGFYSPVFTIPKKSLLIFDLKWFNQYIPHFHFKMEGLPLLQDMLLADQWMAQIDLKQAY